MSAFKDKIVLITGASSGIGRACAFRFASNGAKLILTGRRLEKIQELAENLTNEFGVACLSLCLDVRDKEAVVTSFSSLSDQWKAIDVLVNNAGLALSSDPIQKGDFSNWDTMIDTNIKGLLYVSRTLLPGMVNRGSGHIVNIGSIAGRECYPNGNVYCATKHAVKAISQSLRQDLHGSGIRVTEIAPGAVETEFSLVRWSDEAKAKAFYADFNPLLAEDIADAVYYCTSRPAHVDIAEMVIMPTAQSAAASIYRSTRTI